MDEKPKEKATAAEAVAVEAAALETAMKQEAAKNKAKKAAETTKKLAEVSAQLGRDKQLLIAQLQRIATEHQQTTQELHGLRSAYTNASTREIRQTLRVNELTAALQPLQEKVALLADQLAATTEKECQWCGKDKDTKPDAKEESTDTKH